jgi:hypothetical protein
MFTDQSEGGPVGARGRAPGRGAQISERRARSETRSNPPARRNLIIDWLRHKPAPLLDYVRSLRVMDESLGLALGQGYTLERHELRLATTLFMDFAHDHTLSAGEIALLLEDAARDAREALEFLLERARAEVCDLGERPAGVLANRRERTL